MYSGFITRIKDVKMHPNADRLKIGECFGNQVVVGLNQEDSALGVYFPTDGQLSVEYSERNNLVRKKDENGKEIGGYLDPIKRNIRSIRLRKEISDGLFMPLSSLSTFTDISKLREGDSVTVLNGVEICKKYIPEIVNQKSAKDSNQKNNKIKVKDKYPMFSEHKNTKQLAYNLQGFKRGDICYITLKMHGCFTGSTKVRLWGKSRSVKIKDIKVGDVVVGRDEDGKFVASKVLNTFNNGKSDNWMNIKITRKGFAGEKLSSITCTRNHEFWDSKKNKYVEAEKLQVGQDINSVKQTYKLPESFRGSTPVESSTDVVVGYEETPQKIESIEFLDNKFIRHDIETETHNYVVGDSLVHNSSARTSYSKKQNIKPNGFLKRLITKENHTIKESWEYITGSRRVVLSNMKEGFRKDHHESFIGKLHKGETVYYEIVGYERKNRPIMGVISNKKTNDKDFIKKYGESTTYHYGCNDGENEKYIYRMTMTNEDGVEIDYPNDLIAVRADQMGFKVTPELDRFIFTTIEDLQIRVDKYTSGADPIGVTHIREGVVVRVEGKETFKAYKNKSFDFKCLEGISKDSGVVDVEELESLK